MDLHNQNNILFIQWKRVYSGYGNAQVVNIGNIHCSGLLTGKIKRGVSPEASDSRAGYMADQKKQGQTAWSPYDEVKDREDYWNLVAILERIAKGKGEN